MSEKDEEIVLDIEEEETEVVEETSAEEPEYSEIELQAMEHGWKPDGVEGKKNLTAEEFLDRQQLYDDIRFLKRKNKELQGSFEALQTHHKRVRESEREKLLGELKDKKKLAYEVDDIDTVMAIDDKIADLKLEEHQEKATKSTDNATYQEWVKDNSWYVNDSELKAEADVLGHGYMAAHNGNASLDEVFEYVEKKIKQLYPEKFKKPAQRAAAVEGSSRTTVKPKSSKYSESDMPEEDRRIMNTIVRSGVMKKEQYLKEYFESMKS